MSHSFWIHLCIDLFSSTKCISLYCSIVFTSLQLPGGSISPTTLFLSLFCLWSFISPCSSTCRYVICNPQEQKYLNFFCWYILQRKWMKNTTYLEVNLYLRMLHPLTTTGLAPILILMILNVRITLGIRNMQVSDKWALKWHKRGDV